MGSLRIVAGELRGRRLRVPQGEGVRPTGDRAREALFDILGAEVAGSRVVDAYAGSGALGLEALSRGAARAIFLESDRSIAAVLRANVRSLGVEDRSRVVVGDACRSVRDLTEPVDLVLADPPYGSGEGERLLRVLESASVVVAGGLVVIERDRNESEAVHPAAWERLRTARYGRTCLDFYRTGGAGIRF